VTGVDAQRDIRASPPTARKFCKMSLVGKNILSGRLQLGRCVGGRPRPCVPGGTDHAHAPRRGRNTHMHVSVAGRLPPCAPVWNHGTNAPDGRAHDTPRKNRGTRWQPASLRAARPRPRRRRRRARRPRRVADASPLPVVAQMVRNLPKILRKCPGRPRAVPGPPPGRPPQNLYGRPW
jgi:hypothetical protein